MKKVTIKNKQGVIGWGAEMLDPTQWIADCVDSNAWGLPERWVLHKDEPMAEAYDEADVLEERIVEDMPAVEAVMDDTGAIVQEAIPARTHKEVKLRAEYSVEIENISAQVEQEGINAEALAYLASTDWMVVKSIDTGVPYPEEIKAERAAARARIVK